ncbi:hypothetical protein BH11PLA2_BH11PLA2_36270 [soil metagenome]
MRAIAVTLFCLAIPAYAADKGTDVEFGGMKSTTPGDWKKEEPSNAMRVYQFKLAKAEGDKEDAELALFFFKGGSGTVDANLKRQVAKFNPADGKDKVEETVDKKAKIGGVDATYQDVAGTFIKKPFPMAEKGTPMPNYRQLYVVFETKDGQYYMTLLGPAKTIEKHKKAFDEWLKNFK